MILEWECTQHTYLQNTTGSELYSGTTQNPGLGCPSKKQWSVGTVHCTLYLDLLEYCTSNSNLSNGQYTINEGKEWHWSGCSTYIQNSSILLYPVQYSFEWPVLGMWSAELWTTKQSNGTRVNTPAKYFSVIVYTLTCRQDLQTKKKCTVLLGRGRKKGTVLLGSQHFRPCWCSQSTSCPTQWTTFEMRFRFEKMGLTGFPLLSMAETKSS